MHEITIAQNIIEQANEKGNVKSITIEVGDLGHLPANEMKEILEKLTDWEIKVLRKPAIILCSNCNYKGEPRIIQHLHDHSVYECPKCKFIMPEILEGHDILLKEIEVEE